MPSVDASIEIAADPATVYAWVEDVDNLRVLIPRVEEVLDVEEQPGDHRRVTFVARGPGGVPTRGETRTLERDPPRFMATRMELGSLSGTAERTFTSVAGGTRVHAVLTWEVGGLLGAVTGLLARGAAQRELERTLEVVKRQVEGS